MWLAILWNIPGMWYPYHRANIKYIFLFPFGVSFGVPNYVPKLWKWHFIAWLDSYNYISTVQSWPKFCMVWPRCLGVVNVKLFVHVLKQRLQDNHITEWNRAVCNSNDGILYRTYKLKPFYIQFINSIGLTKQLLSISLFKNCHKKSQPTRCPW